MADDELDRQAAGLLDHLRTSRPGRIVDDPDLELRVYTVLRERLSDPEVDEMTPGQRLAALLNTGNDEIARAMTERREADG